MTIEPTPEQLAQLGAATDGTPIVMLNLLRFREEAADSSGETGAQAYGRYGAAVAEFLERAGGRILLAVAPAQTVIGPADEEPWDLMVAVEYPSRSAFLEMIGRPDYLEVHALREAALSDSRLIACAPVAA